jgi:hypothetical protein
VNRKLLLRILLGALLLGAYSLTAVPQARASALLTINVNGTIATCDNSTMAGVTACTVAGFQTVLGGSGVNAITLIAPLTINGVLLGDINLGSNNPGTPLIAFVLDSKSNVQNNSGAARTLMVDYAINNFTQPAGPNFLSASQTANWTVTTAGDSQSFQAWERNTNDLVVPGPATATAITALCVSPGGVTVSCAQSSPDTAIVVTSPFALTGRQVITMAPGTVGNFSGTSILSAIPQPVPEPSSAFLLVGTGILMFAGRQWRKRKN